MNKKLVFAIRLIFFILFSAVAPFLFIAFRFGIFKSQSETAFSGMGIIALVIVVIVALYIAHKLLSGMPVNMFTQCVNGLLKVIVPLICAILCLNAIARAIDIFVQSLIFITVCEAIAIPINPLPKWLDDVKKKQAEEQK